ncbi:MULTISPECIES: hypothetical protein [Paraclostridium]|uniref:DUF4363 family protein n=2 Tax=Paraclostridium bifermentans TaxID=1490 RepID=A0A5P3XC67_PARBF|nr:hypothetical protein [Paraclostridium bifermentans]MDV8115873.1 hypothetical protein [Bacillus sp. BAU-SS-2023]QEZ67940.1 hypothetical protein D4A35_02950 [Paraclostridium bifermentans]TQO57651.1 hypothetical protein D5S05_06815 [Paraclostridium bifermentans]GKZ01736.1 hypothetical protein ANS014_01700 [Paraclostridium bifermentans]GKZ07168.1 hypothetical protein ANS015_20510 [Paraclostridium bifermentans]
MLKKFSIIIFITLIIFTSNINFSHALNINSPDSVNNQYVKDLEIIDNYMYLLTKSVIMGNYKEDEISKNIKFMETLIDDLNTKVLKLSKEDTDAILAVQSILNFYKISLMKIQSYLETKDPDNLIDAINAFSLASSASKNLGKIIGDVGK